MADPLAPWGNENPYCTVARLFTYHDWQQIADMMRDGDDPRPSQGDLADPGSGAGANLNVLGLAACGEVEAACMAGRYYRPEDLKRLSLCATGNAPPDDAVTARGRLEKLVADIWFWFCCNRRQPLTADPALLPGYAWASRMLDDLRAGARVFGLALTDS